VGEEKTKQVKNYLWTIRRKHNKQDVGTKIFLTGCSYVWLLLDIYLNCIGQHCTTLHVLLTWSWWGVP